MVKLTGPLYSVSASGTLRNLITFNHQPRATTLRRKPRPKHPRTGPQVAVQAALKFVTQQWATLSDDQKATWAAADTTTRASAYTNYVRINTRRIRSIKGPGMTWPVEDTGETTNNWIVGQNCHVRQNFVIHFIWGDPKNTWGFMIFRKPLTIPEPDFQYLIAIVRPEPAIVHAYIDSPLDPIVYRYRSCPFTVDGARTTLCQFPDACQTRYD